jgi:hypothetical protein
VQLRQADDESKLQAKPFPKPFISADVGARVHATASVAACVRVCTAVPGWVRLWMRAGVVACVRASVSACMGVAMLGCVGCAVAWVRACVRLFACAQRALLAPFSPFSCPFGRAPLHYVAMHVRTHVADGETRRGAEHEDGACDGDHSVSDHSVGLRMSWRVSRCLALVHGCTGAGVPAHANASVCVRAYVYVCIVCVHARRRSGSRSTRRQ